MPSTATQTHARQDLLAKVNRDETSAAYKTPQISIEGRAAVLQWVSSGCYEQVINEIAAADPQLAG